MFAGQSQRGDASPTTELFGLYVQYKKDTKDIISWLLSHQPAKSSIPLPERLSVRDLVAVADQICASAAIAMPDVIAFQFRQAITARTYLTKVFRKVSTGSRDLACEENHDEIEHSRHPDMPSNCKESAETHVQISGPELEEAPSTFHDDRLSSAFDMYEQIHDIHQILSGAKAAWRKAAQGSSQLVTATVMTNAAYARLEDVEHRLSTSSSIGSSADLLESYVKLQDSVNLVSPTVTSSDWSAGDAIRDLHECWRTMTSLRSEAATDGFAERFLKPQLPPQVTLRRGSDTFASDAQCRSILLYNAVQCTRGSCLQNDFIRLGSPVVTEIDAFMSREQSPSNCLHCASGLSLLMSSFKAYAFALPAGQSTSSCRIYALRYAQDAVAHIGAVLNDPTMPCRCQGTLAFHLEKLKLDLEEYLRTKMFDLFFQSPWVCGGQLLEMMHALRYYGLRLAAYKSYMGSVVHMYNVLRKIQDFPSIPILEAICENLSDLFFPGGRPDNKNFKTSYFRYLGGRLRFHSQARHRTGCHELAIPVHTAKATAGFVSEGSAPRDLRFDCGRFSLMYRIKERNYRVDEATLDAIKGQAFCGGFDHGDAAALVTPNKSKGSPAKNKETSGHVCDSCEGGPMLDRPGNIIPTGVIGISQALQKMLDAEIVSDFPVAGLNFFTLYLDCVGVVDKISSAYHGADSKQRQFCLCFAEIMVAAADGCREGKGWRVRKEVRELVAICGQALTEGFRDKETRQYYQSRF
ncbi:MAG: hypothetical protein Q9180_000626 [Flavoplaca navasiana]